MPRPLIPVRRAGPVRVLAAVLSRPRVWPALARYLVTVWRDFFWPQYRQRLFKDRTVYAVDGPMDDTIPFRPEYYPQYLSFVDLWIETLAFVGAAAGKGAAPLWIEFLSDLNGLYRDAAAISRPYPTTTTRPPGLRGLRMAVIKLFDPHYHCLPSLHILIVVHTHLKLREWLPRLDGAGEAARLRADHVQREMLEISESVLYVKQHSVSCIAASLFFLTARFPAADEAFAEEYVASLFETETDVDAETIRGHILLLYRGFLEKHRAGRDARAVLVDYITTRK